MLAGSHSGASSLGLRAATAPSAGMDGFRLRFLPHARPGSSGPAAPVLRGAKSPLRPRPRGGQLSPASKCPPCSIRLWLCSKSFRLWLQSLPSRPSIIPQRRLSAVLTLPVGSVIPASPPYTPCSDPVVSSTVPASRPPQPLQTNIDFLLSSLPPVSFPTRPLSQQILPPRVLDWPILAAL